jgi:ribosomal-protein-alanine N-acetyltransferase
MTASSTELRTERLILRRWRETDREPFARMNQDPVVMEFFSARLSPEESNHMMDRIDAQFAERGFSLWAAELRENGEFIGFIGLSVPRFEAAFTPCVEVGWRLAAKHWGKGLATEGAHAAAGFAFDTLGLAELVSFTTVDNLRSRRVMEKLRMTRNPLDDFDHPSLPDRHPLRRHVLYRLQRANWQP